MKWQESGKYFNETPIKWNLELTMFELTAF